MSKTKHGISLLVPTKNSEKTIRLCIETFKEFPDEIILVDNGSTDNTIDIIKELEKEIEHLKFFYKPELPDLYQNRQYALEQSSYNWIVRIDSDYVAYTSGENNILNLRKKILKTKRTIWPKVFKTKQVNLFYDYHHTGIPREERDDPNAGRYVPSPIFYLKARIIQRFNFLKFKRIGRWESLSFDKYLQHITLEVPYWFHCDLKADMDYFYRSERTNWRQLADFKKYPTLESYIKDIIIDKYGTDDLKKACQIYMKKEFFPYLQKYDPEKYYPYPEAILTEMKKGK